MQREPDQATTMLKLHVRPRARRDEVVGWREGALHVRVTAPPVKGKANEAVIRLLAGKLGLKRSEVRLLKGAKSRDKLVEVTGLSGNAVRERLGQSD